ncbi:MAG: hypothetical protein P9M14_18330 [Candidatus Alcyoniella australis]|nr:hypothetical protein [Candidatus Alcyoniella australis]
MSRTATLSAIILCTLLAIPAFAAADDGEQAALLPIIHADFRTFFVHQNDSDFDPTGQLYDQNGQQVGYISTLFRPRMIWQPHEAIELQYELEIGDNIWSRNDANQGDATGEGRPVFRQRQFWGHVGLPWIPVGIGAGYRHLDDPTGLVLDRYLGTAWLSGCWSSGTAQLGAAQVPDTTYEGRDPNQQYNADDDGFDPNRNNFQNDHWVFFGSAKQRLAPGLSLEPGVFFVWDRTLVERTRWHADPLIRLDWQIDETFRVELDLVGQAGVFENGGIDNRDVDLLAAAGQLGFTADWRVLELRIGALAFSADDGDPYNLTDNAFDYSGVSRSRTVLLTEDWLQDRYDNLDERAAAQGAGLLVSDVQVTGRPVSGLELFAVAGYGMVFQERNVGDDPELGIETDLGARIELYGESVALTVLGSALLPGAAAAALSNEIDLEATETLWNVQGAFEIAF